MRAAIVATLFLVILAGCAAAGAPVGGVPLPTSTPDPAQALRSACLNAGGEWTDGDTLEGDLEAAREEEAAAARTAAMTELGASDQFMRAPPPPQMADAAGNLRNNRAYRARERDRLQAAIDSAKFWRIRADETREAVEDIEKLLRTDPLGDCERD